jgi:acyl carrier protein
MATREEYLMVLKEIFSGKARNVDALSDLKEEHKIIDELGVRSVDIVEVTLALERKYGFEVDDTELEKIVTVGDIIDLLQRRVG